MTSRYLREEGPSESSGAREVRNFLLFLALGISLAVMQWWLVGPPDFSSPDPDRIRAALTRSDVSPTDAISVASTIAWTALIYLGVTTGLRLAIGIALRLTDGAAWARGALRLADFATLPLVRRLVDGAVIGLVVITFWLRERAGVEAGAASSESTMVTFLPTANLLLDRDSGRLTDVRVVQAASTGSRVTYSVKEGESLWSIARRLYGDGTHYLTLFRANEGRELASGARLEDPRALQAGWPLNLNLPTPNLWAEEGQVMYRVQAGDSLWRIAESFLGSGFKWVEVWELNQGNTMTDGRPFHDANLIFPGWILQLPVAAVPADQAKADAPSSTTPVPPAVIEASPEPTTPEPTASIDIEAQTTPEARGETGADGTGGSGISLPVPGVQPALLTAAGLVGAASTYLLVRSVARRLRESITNHERPEKDKPADGNAGRVVLAGRALMSAVQAAGFEDARLVLVREAARYQDCLIECPPGDADALARLQYDLSRRLSCGVDAEVVSQTEVRVRLSRFQRLAGLLVEASDLQPPLLLVPVGGRDGSVYYINLAARATTLIAGTDEQTNQLLSVWLRTLEATLTRDELIILAADGIAAGARGLADNPLLQPESPVPTAALFDELVDMIVARERAAAPNPPAAVLALAVAEGPGLIPRVETVIHHGREQGIALVLVADGGSEPELASMVGTIVAFGNSGLAQQITGWDGEGDLVMVAGRREPVGLFTTEVRKSTVPSWRSGFANPPILLESEPWQFDETDEPDAFEADVEKDGQASTLIPSEDLDEDAAPGRADEDEYEGGAPDAFLHERLSESRDEDDAGAFDPEDRPAPEGEEDEALSRQSQTYALGLLGPATPAAHKQLDLVSRNGAAPSVNGTESDLLQAPLFTVRCFGKFEVVLNGRPVRRWRVVKARDLLAFLLLYKGEPVSREAAIEALWPDALPEQTEKLLYDAIYHLRATLRQASGSPRDVEFVASPRQSCLVQMRYFRLDKDAFDAHLSRAATLERGEALAEYEQGLSLYRAGLYEDEPFDWAAPQRHEYHGRYVQAARRAGQIALDCRDTTRAIDFFRGVLDREPLDEEAARGLMLAYASRADLNGVRKVYKVLCQSLRRELDDDAARPLPDTEALFTKLTQASGG